MIDSDEDFNSENFSNMQSARSKKSKTKEVFTVIRRESITPAEKMLIREKEQKEKEVQER